jgi:hypothetical protein
VDIIVLAVTKAFGKYCIAGMNKEGEWVRPIPQLPNNPQETDRFWDQSSLTFNGSFLRIGDVISVDGFKLSPPMFPNHTEDLVAKTISFVESYSVEGLINFLDRQADTYQSFLDTVQGGNERSLCVLEIEDYILKEVEYDGVISHKLILYGINGNDISNPHTNRGLYKLKDYHWEQLIESDNLPKGEFSRFFVCIGLATAAPYDKVEYPMAIGLIPDYSV